MKIQAFIPVACITMVLLLASEKLAFSQNPTAPKIQPTCKNGNCPSTFVPRYPQTSTKGDADHEKRARNSAKAASSSVTNAKATSSESQIVEETNRQRKSHGLAAFAVNPELTKLAEEQAVLMASKNQLSHSVAGQAFSVRFSRSTYVFSAAGENIAEGQSNAEEAVSDWMQSPGHRQNILNSQYTEIGVASLKSASGRKYFVQVFASPAHQ